MPVGVELYSGYLQFGFNCLVFRDGYFLSAVDEIRMLQFFTLMICEQVRMPSLVRSPMKSLEEIKQMFQRFSVRKISAASILSGKDSSSETSNNFVYKLPFFSKMKLASPAEGDKSLEASLDSAGGTFLDCLEKSDLGTDPCDDHDQPSTCEVYYEAESPDEAALVHAARAYKCVLMSRTPDQITVELGTIGSMTFQLLHILPFDSVRKRMSIVVRHPLTSNVVVYTKGADSVIMDLLSQTSDGKCAHIK